MADPKSSSAGPHLKGSQSISSAATLLFRPPIPAGVIISPHRRNCYRLDGDHVCEMLTYAASKLSPAFRHKRPFLSAVREDSRSETRGTIPIFFLDGFPPRLLDLKRTIDIDQTRAGSFQLRHVNPKRRYVST